MLVVLHTSEQTSSTESHIRIISAHRADPAKVRDYEQTPRQRPRVAEMKDHYDFCKGARGKLYR